MMKRVLFLLLSVGTLFPVMLNAKELSSFVANRVNSAFVLQQQDNNVAAIELLERTKTRNDYDLGYVQRMLAVLYWQQEESDKTKRALVKAIESNGLPQPLLLSTQRMLGDILFSEQHYVLAIEQYTKLVSTLQSATEIDNAQQDSLLSSTLLRLAKANYQLQHWQVVLDTMARYQQLIPQLTTRERELLLGAYLALKQWKNALIVVENIKATEPKKARWWKYQIDLQLQLKQYSMALSSLKQYQRAGFSLTKRELMTMAQLYQQQGSPELAARIYQNDIDDKNAQDWATEAGYWQQAKAFSLALVAWNNARQKESRYHWSYVQLLMRDKQYQQVISELDLFNRLTQQQWLTKTEAYFYLGELEMARQSARRADDIKSDGQTAQWLAYFDR